MKKNLLGAVLLSSVILYSCNKDNNVGSSEILENKDYVVLLNEKVKIPQGVNPEAISITNPKDAIAYATKVLSSGSGRSKNVSELDPQAILKLLPEISKKYPVFDFSQILPDEQFKRIQQDFPEIKTQEEAYNKREVVATYYENLKRDELIEKIKTTNIPTISSSSGRTSGFWNDPRLPGGWAWLAIAYYEAVVAANNAASQMEGEVQARFQCDPNNNNDDQSNAFKHAGWCGLIARKLIAAGKSKINGTGEAGVVTSSYECQSVNTDPTMPNGIFMVYTKGLTNAMDLWNNSIGRSYIYHNTTFGAFGIRTSFPSEGYFLNQMHDRLCVQHAEYKFYNALDTNLPFSTSYDPYPILVGVQYDAEAAWTTLYRHTYSNWHNLVTIKTGCQCK